MSVPSGETVARRLLDCEVAALDFLIRAARAEGAAEAERENSGLRRQLGFKDEALHRKNLELDALHFVWCDGGCASGVHRFGEHPALTEEIVAEAERNAVRLRRWLSNAQARSPSSGTEAQP